MAGLALSRLTRPWIIVAATVGGDRLTKVAVQSSLHPAQSVPILPSLLHVTYVQNTGSAFGLFRGYPGVVAVLSVLVALWVWLELLQKRPHPWPAEIGLALILGGAIGNLIDRLALGYVVDFLDVRVWPVFNVADSAITIGVGLLIWQVLRPLK